MKELMELDKESFLRGQTCNMKATTMTVMKRVAVSKSWKFKSIGRPMIHPTTTQKGICSHSNNESLHKVNNPKGKAQAT